MSHRPTPPTTLWSLAILAWLTTSVASAAPTPGTPAPAGGTYLPDSFVVLRVDDRAVTVREYLEKWFNTWPEDRPTTDSTGRVQFLHTLVNQRLRADAAKKANPALTFEQRSQLRAYQNHFMAYVLRLRTVDDSVQVTPEDMERIRLGARSECRYQLFVFEDRATAVSARRDLV